jgi:hypothetical protein
MTVDTNRSAEVRLRWLIAAIQDPTSLTVADIDEAYRVPEEWHDFTPEREIDFLTNGPHAGSRPLTVARLAPGEHDDATAILEGADGKRFALTVWSEDGDHITGARIVPAAPDGMEIRLATPDDGLALAELERRAPLRLGKDPLTFMTSDHGDDYFAPSRLMDEVTIYVAEHEGRIVGVYCGAVQPVEVDGETKRLFLEHHVRIDPEAPRGGVFWALCAYGRDRYARSTDSIAFYVSVENHAVRKFTDGTPGWSVQPRRALIPCHPDDSAADARFATEDDAAAIIGAINGSHAGSPLFAPYTEDSLRTRVRRDPDQYGWGSFAIAGGATIGVGRDLVKVTKACDGAVDVSMRALAIDHGFVPGAEDDYRRLLRWLCAHLAERGATHLAVFTSERSATYDVLSELAESIEVFDFWAFNIPEPPALAERGFYVDPVYF